MMNAGAGLQSDPAGWETLELFADVPAFNQWLLNRILPYCNGHVLEAGSGIGNISGLLLDKHLKVSLSDLRSEYCLHLNKRFAAFPDLEGIYQMDLSLPDFENRYPDLLGRFDTVVALNVVEHIKHDALAIQNAKKLLRNNGTLIVLVPAGKCLYNNFDRELGHYKRYSRKTLGRLLRAEKLTITCMSYFNFAGILGWWFSGSVMRKKIIPRSQLKLYNQLVPLFRFLDQLVAHAAGLSVIAVTTKQTT
ncbi:MAG: class I SAM-dependent methyltransferase [Chitinophagales bacterium]